MTSPVVISCMKRNGTLAKAIPLGRAVFCSILLRLFVGFPFPIVSPVILCQLALCSGNGLVLREFSYATFFKASQIISFSIPYIYIYLAWSNKGKAIYKCLPGGKVDFLKPK